MGKYPISFTTQQQHSSATTTTTNDIATTVAATTTEEGEHDSNQYGAESPPLFNGSCETTTTKGFYLLLFDFICNCGSYISYYCYILSANHSHVCEQAITIKFFYANWNFKSMVFHQEKYK